MISIRAHNVMDYVIGAFLFLCPALFGFSGIDAARNTFVVLGVGLIAYSLFTKYPYSMVKLIPLGVHMAFDVAAGVALLLAPSIFGYRDQLTGTQNALHIIMGLGAIALVIFTRPSAAERRYVSRKTEEPSRIDRAA